MSPELRIPLARSVRMSDVARVAGVGTMTVSRVLNGNDRVSPENRTRVLAAIRSLQYVPNQVARSLRQQRTRQIGMIVPNIRDPFFAVCSDAVGTVARGEEYSVVLAISDEDPEREFKEAMRLLHRSVDGLIITPAAKGRSRLTEAAFQDFPIVAVDRPLAGSSAGCVLVHNEHGAFLGTEHLIQHGHRSVAYLSLSGELYTMDQRKRGYERAMAAAGRKPVTRMATSKAETFAAVKQLLGGRAPVSAFFCANNVVSCNVFHALSALGLRIPEDVAVVGFDDFETADLLKPAMTVVRQPCEAIGRTAAELLFQCLQQTAEGTARTPGQQHTLPTELVIRNSCGCSAPSDAGELAA